MAARPRFYFSEIALQHLERPQLPNNIVRTSTTWTWSTVWMSKCGWMRTGSSTRRALWALKDKDLNAFRFRLIVMHSLYSLEQNQCMIEWPRPTVSACNFSCCWVEMNIRCICCTVCSQCAMISRLLLCSSLGRIDVLFFSCAVEKTLYESIGIAANCHLNVEWVIQSWIILHNTTYS